jgi:Holliday junction DNA helicase RuvA
MIALLTGLVASLDESTAIIDVAGVGYLVQASTRTLAALPRPPEPARLLIDTIIREDAFLLFGFADPAERDWFRLLTTVQGVGAKVALGILSALSPKDLATAIGAGDRAALTRAPGVGPKLAIRLLTELREKSTAMPTGSIAALAPAIATGSVASDVFAALSTLGYRRAEAAPVLNRVLEAAGKGASIDTVLRQCLRELAR